MPEIFRKWWFWLIAIVTISILAVGFLMSALGIFNLRLLIAFPIGILFPLAYLGNFGLILANIIFYGIISLLFYLIATRFRKLWVFLLLTLIIATFTGCAILISMFSQW